jgi:hypothetical protein
MRHLLLVLVLTVVGYAFWVLSDKRERAIAVRHITRHGLRLGFIVLILVLLLLAATQMPSTSII